MSSNLIMEYHFRAKRGCWEVPRPKSLVRFIPRRYRALFCLQRHDKYQHITGISDIGIAWVCGYCGCRWSNVDTHFNELKKSHSKRLLAKDS